MDNLRTFGPATEVKIFDPRDPSSGSGGAELVDASVVQRNDQWWLYLAGQAHGYWIRASEGPSRDVFYRYLFGELCNPRAV